MSEQMVVVEDVLMADGTRRVHILSNQPVEYPVPEEAQVERRREAGTHQLIATWRMRGPVQIVMGEWRRTVVLWPLSRGERVSTAALRAAEAYLQHFGAWPPYAWVRSLPRGVENAALIMNEGREELMLFQADFMPVGFVAVGDGGDVSGVAHSLRSVCSHPASGLLRECQVSREE